MANDTYKGVGWCIGFLAGWVLEKRQIGLSTGVPMMTRLTRLVTCFLQMFYISYIFPWCIKHAEYKKDEKERP